MKQPNREKNLKLLNLLKKRQKESNKKHSTDQNIFFWDNLTVRIGKFYRMLTLNSGSGPSGPILQSPFTIHPFTA